MSVDRSALPARDRILLTAHDLFYREGIRATGIDPIIRQAGVTKVTFYRHFASKNLLVSAFLDYRHEQWMTWFEEKLAQEMGACAGDFPLALTATLAEWFESEDFRGCAFINSALEFSEPLPQVLDVAASHKQQMADAIAACLPESAERAFSAQTIAMITDGAIVTAQINRNIPQVLSMLKATLVAFTGQPPAVQRP